LALLFVLAAPDGRNPFQFDSTSLLELLGPVNFFGVWLAYGFCVGQVFVLLCRKTVYAAILSGMVTIAALGMWLPSLLCRGMSGWQMWLPPVGMLIATRMLIRAWAGGRIKDRKPLAGLVGFAAAALVWFGVNCGYRAWQIPDVGEPMDSLAFRVSIPTGNANLAAQRI